MKLGDLVRSKKYRAIGIVVDIFDDLNPNEPWIRVRFTHPADTFQWCKGAGLETLPMEKNSSGDEASGSL